MDRAEAIIEIATISLRLCNTSYINKKYHPFRLIFGNHINHMKINIGIIKSPIDSAVFEIFSETLFTSRLCIDNILEIFIAW